MFIGLAVSRSHPLWFSKAIHPPLQTRSEREALFAETWRHQGRGALGSGLEPFSISPPTHLHFLHCPAGMCTSITRGCSFLRGLETIEFCQSQSWRLIAWNRGVHAENADCFSFPWLYPFGHRNSSVPPFSPSSQKTWNSHLETQKPGGCLLQVSAVPLTPSSLSAEVLI